MEILVTKANLDDVAYLRQQFLQENNFQVRYESCHSRNWADEYLLELEGTAIGYGSVKGMENLSLREAIFEFYLIPPYRKYIRLAFAELIKRSGVKYVECQSNDFWLSAMLYEHCHHIESDIILFEDGGVRKLEIPGLYFRERRKEDTVFGQDQGGYVLLREGSIVATGGFLTHYNPPFADLYMEVKADCRRQGFGAYILQELKRVCYEKGKVPAARCYITNAASRATLLKAGFRVYGYMLKGVVKPR